jgi:hypothetical protein
MQPIQEILYMVGLMKFKTQKKNLKKTIKKMLKIEMLQILADGKFIFSLALRLHIRTQK